jgi:hypothetical protein
VVPVLQVSTFDPTLDATLWCGSGGPLGSSDAILYVALDAAAMRSGEPLPPPWPVELRGLGTPQDGPCGPGAYARFSLGGTPYFAFVSFGSDVTSGVRQRTLDVFGGIQAADVAPPVPAGLTPGYVIAAGSVDGDAWRLELGASPPTPITATTSFAYASVITGSEDFLGRTPISATPMPATAAGIGGAVMFPVGSQGVVVGSVVPDAAAVSYVAHDGTQADMALVDVPPSLRAVATTANVSVPDRVSWGLGDPHGGEIVELAADGTELLRRRIIVLGTANRGSNPSTGGGDQLAYDVPDGGPITALGTFQGTDWKVEVLFYKDGVRLTIGGTPEDLGVMRSNEPLVRPIGSQGFGALVLVLTDLSVDHVAVTSEGSWKGRWMPASTGDGAEARLWVVELPGAGTGSLELNGQPSGSVSWP